MEKIRTASLFVILGAATPAVALESRAIVYDGARIDLIADEAKGRLLVRIDGAPALW